MQTFSSLGLSKPLLDAITEEGYDTPTAVQAGAIPPVLAGRDVLALAQTGTGKTAAFALPVLDRLLGMETDKAARSKPGPRALILSPTRELATQIAGSMRDYGRHTGLSGCTIFGGVRQSQQVRNLRRGVDIIVATPGRLMDLMEQGHVDLSNIRVLVLDEADRMLDMGFINPIRKIAAQLPKQRQSLMFSATMPKDIAQLASTLLTDPVRVEVAPAKRAELKIEQKLHMVDGKDKPTLLATLLEDAAVLRAVVFTKTKHGADHLTHRLSQGGVQAESIHGNKSQNQRDRALHAFRSGRARVLVATDVAARGLDVDGVTHVFNYNLPNEPEAYVHRIGRTGRAGATGIAVSFCDPTERGFLRSIERLIGRQLDLASGERRENRSFGDSPRSGGGKGRNRPARGQERDRAPGGRPGQGKPGGKAKHRGSRPGSKATRSGPKAARR